jgi:hypothetical protein
MEDKDIHTLQFLGKVSKLADEYGVIDWMFVGVDIDGDDFQEAHVGSNEPSISNKLRTFHILGLMKELEYDLVKMKDEV